MSDNEPSTGRERVISALAKVRNDSNDCACDGCLVDAVAFEIAAIFRERPLGEPPWEPPIRPDDWAANFIEGEVGRV